LLFFRSEDMMRNEMIGAVVRRAIEHPEFCRRLIENPKEALTAHGFALEDSDMAEIERIRAHLDQSTDVERQLVTIAEQYGVHPRV
jgi:hypothetical protein